ncbi:FAD-dependent monooxygenase [uncultured Xylophilus sp.]|uniref:FAD-dependent monooxygenase n=1 Tax=uncultured Xylophilus sp. TaxID=296832 RepID=UPI0025E99B8D|nr:FAD-dependent monooxygenase [uncultured Xylophilus sp.]
MAHTLDVCIRGAGVVGRTLALLLARERLRVGLVGTPAGDPGASPDVRAYALNAASRTLLASLRSWPDAPHCTPVSGMEVHGDEGATVRFDAAGQGADALAWIVDVPALETRLADALRYQPQVELLDAPRPAALTVVCEGRASATRAEFGVGFETTPYAQRAIAARLQAARPHGGVARQWFLADGVLALLPLGGADAHAVALVWSADTPRADALMALDDAAFAQEVDAATGHALGPLTPDSRRCDWPLQLARADRWTGPMPAGAGMPAGASWVLAGDAAHTVHPLAGQGLNIGLADAEELARVLHERDYWRSPGDARLLRRYERARKAGLAPMRLATDGLQQLFAQPGRPWQTLRNWGMRGFDGSGPVKSWVARQAMGA